MNASHNSRVNSRYKSPQFQAELLMLKNHGYTVAQMVESTGTPKHTVRRALEVMGLTKKNKGRKCIGRCGDAYVKEFQDKVLALRAQDMPVAKIVKELGSTIWTVTKVLTVAGILNNSSSDKRPKKKKECDTCGEMFEPSGAIKDCPPCREYHKKMEAEDEARLIESELKQHLCRCGSLYASPKDARGMLVYHQCYDCRIENNRLASGSMG